MKVVLVYCTTSFQRIPFPHTAFPHATFPGTSTSQAFSAYPRLHLWPHSQTFHHVLRLFMPTPCKPCLFDSFLNCSFLIPKQSTYSPASCLNPRCFYIIARLLPGCSFLVPKCFTFRLLFLQSQWLVNRSGLNHMKIYYIFSESVLQK